MIELPPLGVLGTGLWHVLLDLREETDGWTLIGGQMVLLHAIEQRVSPPRVSEDIDLVADVRAQPPRMGRIVTVLDHAGFELGAPDPDGYAHRFSRGRLVIDLLMPDNMGTRARARTSDSTQTTPISGGTFALERSIDVPVVVDGRTGTVPRPDLAGALVVKARAAVNDRRRGPDRHYRDIAFLCSLISDPLGLRSTLTERNSARLAEVEPLLDPRHEAWTALEDGGRDAYAAFRLVART